MPKAEEVWGGSFQRVASTASLAGDPLGEIDDAVSKLSTETVAVVAVSN